MPQERPQSRWLALAFALAAARTVWFVRMEGAELRQPPVHSMSLRHECRAPTASLQLSAGALSCFPRRENLTVRFPVVATHPSAA